MDYEDLLARASATNCRGFVEFLLKQNSVAVAEAFVSQATSLIEESVAIEGYADLVKSVRQALAGGSLQLAQLLITEVRDLRWMNMSVRGLDARVRNLPVAHQFHAKKQLGDLFPIRHERKKEFEKGALALDTFLCRQGCY